MHCLVLVSWDPKRAKDKLNTYGGRADGYFEQDYGVLSPCRAAEGNDGATG